MVDFEGVGGGGNVGGKLWDKKGVVLILPLGILVVEVPSKIL